MDYLKLSKEISYILRHHPEEYNLTLDEFGYVEIEKLLNTLNNKKQYPKEITLEDIKCIMKNAEKKRWEISEGKIRALYGHSFEKDIKQEEKKPPNTLYHGTSHKALEKILSEGLLPIERQFVHLSEDVETAIIVGKRRDLNPIILEIDSQKAYKEGIKFYCANDKVWLAKSIPVKYIKVRKNDC